LCKDMIYPRVRMRYWCRYNTDRVRGPTEATKASKQLLRHDLVAILQHTSKQHDNSPKIHICMLPTCKLIHADYNGCCMCHDTSKQNAKPKAYCGIH